VLHRELQTRPDAPCSNFRTGARRGREIQFTFTPAPVAEAMRFLERVSKQWDQALGRLKAFVEDPPGTDPR
jgi:hypothetical protein